MSPDRVKNTAPGSGNGDDGGAEGAPDPRVGTSVDRYTITKLLGRGGMGTVYEARHATISRRFAIKFLLPQLAQNREILRRFENEAKAAGSLEHPNLAAVTDFGRAPDGAPYIVLEYLPGEDCSKTLRRLGPLPIQRATDIVIQACRGLAVAHGAGIIHRDLKPENLFLTKAGDGSDLVKVLDFGIAKLRSTEGSLVTSTGATFGTAHYMSPEQARGAGDVDERTDVWSLGVVLYELLSGRKPFEGDQFLHVIHQILSADPQPLTSLRADLPAGLAAVVAHAMSKDLGQRLRSAIDMERALVPFAARAWTGNAAVARTTMPTPVTSQGSVIDRTPTQPPRRKRWRLAFLGAAACAAAAGLLVREGRRPNENVALPPPPTASPAAPPSPPRLAPPTTSPTPPLGNSVTAAGPDKTPAPPVSPAKNEPAETAPAESEIRKRDHRSHHVAPVTGRREHADRSPDLGAAPATPPGPAAAVESPPRPVAPSQPPPAPASPTQRHRRVGDGVVDPFAE